ncbi:MAG: glycosyltransferase family 4 protein, partial [Bdellovibrionales bacterium]|nr:glycosyltransferase family 4 protein [Bdellovibrionales bacterium]
MPFTVEPKEQFLWQAAMWRSLDLSTFGGERVDLVIATKFPSYYARHPKKSLWLVHQHRAIYDLYGGRYSDFSDDPRDEELRKALVLGDTQAIGESNFISGISKNVVDRLKNFNGIEGKVLYPPLNLAGQYYTAESEPYVLSVGRICSIKRVDLMVKALPFIHPFVKLKVVGRPDEPGVMEYLQNEIAKHHLHERVEFLGRVSDEALLELYSKCMAVYYAPHNEDYGYVTLEGMASSKPVLSATDSGGVLEFVRHEENGLIVEPTSEAIGNGVNRLAEDMQFAARLGAQGRRDLNALGIEQSGWEDVIQGLLSPLSENQKTERVSNG